MKSVGMCTESGIEASSRQERRVRKVTRVGR